ncbi:hypothetical protein BRADI_1g24131v3 [Brachypodium distachyon]|uniref:Uncharacterized protein n=1 Tax=Brachypodium distachyon TaxID=15368 RepID=A0A2K2DKU0_BRADI|nr:hypothetical protein BRADI_1g24131v3 [Brachypodium distachyon]
MGDPKNHASHLASRTIHSPSLPRPQPPITAPAPMASPPRYGARSSAARTVEPRRRQGSGLAGSWKTAIRRWMSSTLNPPRAYAVLPVHPPARSRTPARRTIASTVLRPAAGQLLRTRSIDC